VDPLETKKSLFFVLIKIDPPEDTLRTILWREGLFLMGSIPPWTQVPDSFFHSSFLKSYNFD
jgi:hypothetical protein